MGPLGWQETVFIFVLALLLFGPRKLPELGKTIGKALTEFRRASNDLKSTFDREMANLEKETEELKAETNKVHSEIQSTVTDGSYGYDYNYYDSGYDGYQPYETAGSSASTVSASATPGADSVPVSNDAGNPLDLPDAPPSRGVEGTVPVETANAAPPASAPVEAEPARPNA
jgi:TatA/E family protein of Tat protein translocase